MQRIGPILFLLDIVVVLVVGCAPAISPNVSVEITERDQSFDITVPVSKLVLHLPKAGFQRSKPPLIAGSTANPRYFVFEDSKRGIILSGWLEHASQFHGVKEPLVGSLEGRPQPHTNVSFEKSGAWDIVSYDIPVQSVVYANLQAHLVRAGTWIELHLSCITGRPVAEQRALLIETLGSIQIQEKLAASSPDEMLKDFTLLINKVRGAIRYRVEEGEGCLPWASLAIDPNDPKSIVDYGFTAEMVKQLGDVSAKSIGARLGVVANKGSYTLSAIGTCETDSSIGKGTAPNVISLVLEYRDGPAIKMRFPFVQNGDGQVRYLENKASVEQATRLVFTSTAP